MSPISSSISVPPSASSMRPAREAVAPVNAPFSCPNSSLSINSPGIAVQFTTTNGCGARWLPRWISRATSSLPVPVSPRTSTVESTAATRPIVSRSAAIAGLSPTSRSYCSGSPARSRSWRCSASARACASARWSRTSSSSGSTGFVRYWYAPSFIASTAVRTEPKAVIRIVGTFGL